MAAENIPLSDLYVFQLPKKVLSSLEVLYFDSATTQAVSQVPLTTASLTANSESLADKAAKQSLPTGCLTCDFQIQDDEAALKEHYRSDFHRFNLKRRANHLTTVTESEFEKLMETIEDSISGSEASEESEEGGDQLSTIYERSVAQLDDMSLEDGESSISFMNTRSPYILFKSSLLPDTKALGIFKSVFFADSLKNGSPLDDLLAWNKVSQKAKSSALFMIGGGHFAGAIIAHERKSVKGNAGSASLLLEQAVDLIEHKTFHRYTTRRKQGGAQGASDNAKGKANSAGSSLRRYNERALEMEVRNLLQSWKGHLKNCESIFIRANGSSNRNILVGYDGGPLRNNDPRIKSFPFTTKRATTSELRKAWVNLTYALIVDTPKVDHKAQQRHEKQAESLSNSTKLREKKVDSKTDDERHTDELISLMKRSKAPAFISYIRKNKISEDFKLVPQSLYKSTPTLLHYAASQGLTHMIHVLLTNLKFKPDVVNVMGKTPYDVASSRVTKQVFQIARFNLGEDFCDWTTAHVAEAKSKEAIEEEEQADKQLEAEEKRRALEVEMVKHKAKVQEDRESKFGPAKSLGVQTSISNDMSQLSEAQKMRLMREQRARAAEERMKRVAQ